MNIDQLLGGISAASFLAEYWQKKPLLVRCALPDFQDLLSPAQLFALAGQDQVTARLVKKVGNGWSLQHGPLLKRDMPTQKTKCEWTILVQELNHHVRQAEVLLQRFNFIPYARLDDLMVSYAVAGGGVGPHFDSYDVFLVQGRGHRLWQVAAQDDLALIDGLPLKILRNFTAEQEWVLAPGDMLYLPPRYAHNGIAQDECMTYSIGFRAPSTQEITTQFLIYLQDRLELPGMYRDPNITLQQQPAEIAPDMIEKLSEMIQRIRWDDSAVKDFIGRYLTEPKAHIYFNPSDESMGVEQFAAQVLQQGVRLAPQSRLLFIEQSFYLNGEKIDMTYSKQCMHQLANERALSPQVLPVDCVKWLYECYVDGFIVF